ncbi:uncharacterized protein LOC120313980 isoform X2 [Crotalus tigris]|nr:uncharacterized protein LOC120313980 isoform X2 [Crotalus tigris]
MATEDTEASYQRRIRELERELDHARKDNHKLVCLLNEIDQLVLPELSECTELRLSERLRVYLECLLMEKQELEGRAFVAERTMVELEHTVAVLQRQLQDTSCSSAQTGESQQPAPSPSQPSSRIQASNRFFFKINKKSAEKITASNLQKQGDAVLPKQKFKKRLVKIHRQVLSKPATRSRKVCLSKGEEQLTEHTQDLSPTMSSPEADSHQSMLQFPEASTAGKHHRSEAFGDEHTALHKDDGVHVHKRVQEEDTLSTASTLSMTIPLNFRSRDDVHEFLNHPSVNQESHTKNPMLEKSEVENVSGSSNDVSLLRGEGCKEDENHDSTDHNISQKPEVPADFPQPAAETTKSARNPQLTSPVAGEILEDGSLSFSTIHKSDDTVALKPTISHILPAEEMPHSFGLLQEKPEKAASVSKQLVFSSQDRGEELSLEKNEANVQLPSTSINSSETKTNSI